MITKQGMVEWALRHQYSKDKWGHYQKEMNGETYRLRLSNVMARRERKLHFEGTEYSSPHNEWTRLRSGYYKDISLSQDDKLKGLK